MSGQDRQSADRLIIGAVIICALIGAGLLGMQLVDREPPADTPTTTTTPADTAPPAGEETAEAAPSDLDEAPVNAAPSFDIVRIDPDGSIVSAGRAAPDSRILIYRNDQEVAEVTTDSRGEWTWVPGERLPAGSHTLQLRMPRDDGTVALSEPVVVLGSEQVASADSSTPRTVIMLGENADGSSVPRVLQREAAGESDLSLDSVQYGISKPLSMSGTGPANGRLAIVLDGDRLGQVLIDADGNWRFETSRIMVEGEHSVELTVNDGAAQRYPFTIDYETGNETLASNERLIVIKPGANLWRIAEATYGSGLRYTLIFQANQDKIRDPDMIFPGQVFTLPTGQ
ncbi:MAG: hypothetical protein CL558_11490 [Alphaproteobacteria bacterium]|nr:hypothetical protein [Alphaproteobacteria bacterium]MAS46138.1 hypothetical protein [Alphaproteobacteria bacterium]MAX95678.1 hypothetical protein [Alphaproteobacteria bacterium]MBN54186.1 hypothetical protein [Alphaproteobacteria bacterium]OUT42234.1 MAG: hypothetical protein CBB62_08095 [Micavibrio sp. TMED2]